MTLPPGGEELLERVRAICLALPEATEGAGVGNPSWRVRDKIFAMRECARMSLEPVPVPPP